MAAKLSLLPLAEVPAQAYFSSIIQISDVMDWVLGQVGPAEVAITTFSTSEEFIRRIARLKQKGIITRCTLFCDTKAARKTLAIYSFIAGVFDEVRLCENHSKVILFHGEGGDAAIVTSQNQTRGNRFECGIVTSMPSITAKLRSSLDELHKTSRPLHELISTAN